ncbi:MAG: hypothetical protein FJ303_05040 [Planctomycetes bacterium]|nr:hypothetical protein [Planctomycetota bacterium]
MQEHEIEERLDVLEKKVEDLAAELQDVKNHGEEEPKLIPGAEFDFVPSAPQKVIARGVAKIIRVGKAPDDLGLSAREWELLSADGDEHA